MAELRQHSPKPGLCQVLEPHLDLAISLRQRDLDMQMLHQTKLEPHRCTHRFREDCLRAFMVGPASAKLHALVAPAP